MPRNLLEWIPAVAFAAALGFALWFTVLRDDSGDSPISIDHIALEPSEFHVGDEVQLINGICSDAKQPIPIQVYLGAESVEADPLAAERVHFVGEPDDDGRARRLIQPGCSYQEPIEATAPGKLRPGTYRLVLEIVVERRGEVIQEIHLQSPTFRVLDDD